MILKNLKTHLQPHLISPSSSTPFGHTSYYGKENDANGVYKSEYNDVVD